MSTPVKSDEIRKKLIEAAGQVMSEVGYEAATVRHITERAGVNVAAINYYFGDKQQLYRSVLETVTGSQVRVLNRDCTHGDPHERLRRYVYSILMMRSVEEYTWAPLLMAREITELNEGQVDFIVEAVRPLHTIAETIVADLVGGKSEKSDLAASMVVTLCVNRVRQQRLEERLAPDCAGEHDDPEATVEAVFQFALAGIRALCGSNL